MFKIIDEAGSKPRRVQLFRTANGLHYVYGTRLVRPDGSEIPDTSRLWGSFGKAVAEFAKQSAV